MIFLHFLYRLLKTKNGDIGQDIESSKRIVASKPLDPSSIDPLYRSRLKKQAKLLATSDKNEVKKDTPSHNILDRFLAKSW